MQQLVLLNNTQTDDRPKGRKMNQEQVLLLLGGTRALHKHR